MADTDWNAFTDGKPAAGDKLVVARAGAGVNLDVADFPSRDVNGNISFAADPATYPRPLCYGYYGGFSSPDGTGPGLLYQAIATDFHLFSILNNAFPAGNGAYTSDVNYIRTGTSATRYSSYAGRHLFQAAVPGTAGQVISWIDQVTMMRDGKVGIGHQSPTARLHAISVDEEVPARLETSTATASFPVIEVVHKSGTGDNVLQRFHTDAGAVSRGSISYNRGGGLIAYNTTSDYRAKDDMGPVTDVGDLVDALRPFMGQMHGAEDSRPMFAAHEVAEAGAPWCVTGEKDAVDADGQPILQQLDMTPLIPVLIAEIQSLRARVAALEAAA